jgi:hypothetical protein
MWAHEVLVPKSSAKVGNLSEISCPLPNDELRKMQRTPGEWKPLSRDLEAMERVRIELSQPRNENQNPFDYEDHSDV